MVLNSDEANAETEEQDDDEEDSQEEDSEAEEEEDTDGGRRALTLSLYQRLFGQTRSDNAPTRFERLCDVQPVSLRSKAPELSLELNNATSAAVKRPLGVWVGACPPCAVPACG